MRRVLAEEALRARIERLSDEFLSKTGNSRESEEFLRVLPLFPNGGAFGRYERAAENLRIRLLSGGFSPELDVFPLAAQAALLARIIAEIDGGTGFDSAEELDFQAFERCEAVCETILKSRAFGSPFVDSEALGWGSGGGRGMKRRGSLETVKKYLSELEKDSRLSQIAARVGRHSLSAGGRIEAKNGRPAVSYDGIRFSDDIRAVTTSELSLLSNSSTRMEFSRKFAERQLLCFRPGPDRSAADGPKKPKGAAVVCLDTSGSMHGRPEIAAKALALGVLRHAQAEGRKFALISFSSETETLVVENPEKAGEMAALEEFLEKSFHGGTDISHALEKAVECLEEKFAFADILAVSDFAATGLTARAERLLEGAKSRGTSFHALCVGSRGSAEILSKMDRVDFFEEAGR